MKNMILLVGTLLFFSCNHKEENYLEELKQQIIQTDIAMGDLAGKVGLNNSILQYANEDIVKLGEGKLPIIGKTKFAASYDKNTDVKTITWRPIAVEIAKSGELGFTWGNWEYNTNDTIFFGNYFTVWKRDTSGKWKVILDGGNNTPKPTN